MRAVATFVLIIAAQSACRDARESTAPVAQTSAPPRTATAAPSRAPAYRDLNDELNQRFLAAMRATVAAPVTAWDEGGLTGLHYLERDFGIQANAQQTTELVVKNGKVLPRLVRYQPKGLQSERLLEKKVDFAWLRANMKTGLAIPLSETAMLVLAAQAAVSACLAEEADYNARLLAHLDTLAWPAGTEWIRYGMYAGFAMHGCIPQEVAYKQTAPLVKPLVRWLAQNQPSDLKAYVLFALAASDRLGAVPGEILLRFVRAQNPDGTWRSGHLELPAENQAPLGAYVIAAMLRAAALPLPQTDFRITSQLPVTASLPLTSHGRDKP